MNNVSQVNFPDEVVAKIQVYSKKELCTLYKVTKNTLCAWINRSRSQFEATGYTKHQKLLTIKQVDLCFQLWGEP